MCNTCQARPLVRRTVWIIVIFAQRSVTLLSLSRSSHSGHTSHSVMSWPESGRSREITDHRSQLLRREERNIDQKSELLGATTLPPPPHPFQLQVKYYVIHSLREGQNVNIINYVVLKAVNSEVKNSLNCEWVFFYNLANTMQWKAWKIMSIVSFIKSYETGVSESFISRHKIFIEVFRAVGWTLHYAATA